MVKKCLASQLHFMKLRVSDHMSSMTLLMAKSIVVRTLVHCPFTMSMRLKLQLKFLGYSRKGTETILNTLLFKERVDKLLCNVCNLFLLILYLATSFRCPSEFIGGRIGIITPYKSQLSLLRSRFLSAFGSSVIDDMELNTVDGFQGREVDIILLSTVRAGDPNSALRIKSSNIGFVADVRRMNVALTRAKLSLWVLGNARTLMTNHNWAALLKDAKARNLVISVKMPYGSMFKTAFCRNDVPGISVNHSGQKKYVEKVYDASWHAKQTVRNTNQSFEREKRNVGCANQSKRIGIGDEKYLAATKDSSLVANGKNRTSEDVKRANSGKHARVGERKGKESSEKKVGLGNTDMSKRKHEFDKSNNHSNHSERELADGHKLSKSHVSKKLKKSSDGGRSEQGNQATQLTEVSFKERDANVRGKAPSQVGRAEDLIEKRKQREAVDAILCSSLISSKKSEMSMKPLPAKRSFSSSSNVSGGIKPHKTSKGTLFHCAVLF